SEANSTTRSTAIIPCFGRRRRRREESEQYAGSPRQRQARSNASVRRGKLSRASIPAQVGLHLVACDLGSDLPLVFPDLRFRRTEEPALVAVRRDLARSRRIGRRPQLVPRLIAQAADLFVQDVAQVHVGVRVHVEETRGAVAGVRPAVGLVILEQRGGETAAEVV